MQMRDMLSRESLNALEGLGRAPRVRGPKKRIKSKKKLRKMATLRDLRTAPPRFIRKDKLPFILGVIRDAGYDTVFLGTGRVGCVEAHWTREEQAVIHSAILNKTYTTRQTWTGSWGVVIA